jgi:hypothetical protein
MDKQPVGERIATLEEKVKTLEEERKAWRALICDAVRHAVVGIIGVLLAGFAFGWHVPEMARKAFAEWISR